MRNNPFMPIYDLCNAGNSRQKLETLPSFPRLMDIELTNTCNFRCLMCPTGNFSQKRPSGLMEPETFLKVADEAAEHGTPLRFIRWGEPTMHPRFLEYVRAAKDRGLLVHVNTNGSYMTDEMIGELIEIPLDSLKFSFQGVDRVSYSEMRNRDYFIELVATIRRFHGMRGDRAKPFLQVSTTITYEAVQQVKDFTDEMKTMADMVNVGHTTFDWLDLKAVRLKPHEIAMLERLKGQESLNKIHPECPEVFDKLSINWDGKVTACCMDSDNLMIIGDIARQSLAEIWTSSKMREFREVLADMRHDDLPLCKNCYDSHGLAANAPKASDDGPGKA